MYLDEANELEFDDIAKMAVELFNLWKDQPVRQSPPTPEALMASLLAEIEAANYLHLQGYHDLYLNGVADAVRSIQINKPYSGTKADITGYCLENGASVLKRVEVKSGRPDRFRHRQYSVNHVQQYEKNSVNLLIWVDVIESGQTHVHSCLHLDQVKQLKLVNNKFGKECYTLTGGYYDA